MIRNIEMLTEFSVGVESSQGVRWQAAARKRETDHPSHAVGPHRYAFMTRLPSQSADVVSV